MSIDIEEAGNPRRKTKRGEGEPSGEESQSEGSSGDRKTRISVTPKDPETLEKEAEKLGLPKSKVYNMGFQALLEKLGFDV